MDTRIISPGIKQPRCEADHSPPSIIEVKNAVELHLQLLI